MSREEQIKFEHSSLLEEFKAVRADILFQVSSSRQVINITLTAAGVLIAGTPYIIQSQLPSLFLVAPLVFYVLAWVQVGYRFLDHTLSDYLVDILVPRIRHTLSELSPETKENFDSIMSFETYLRNAHALNSRLLFPTASGTFGINILAIVLSITAYFLVVNQAAQPITLLDQILIVLNMLLLLYTVFLGFFTQFRAWRRTRKPRHISEQDKSVW